jgi:transcription initiation factor IIE alpha subunit
MIDGQGLSKQLEIKYSENEDIRQRLATYFMYFNEQDGAWHTLTNLTDPICIKDTILLQYRGAKKLGRQSLRLPFPFTLPKDLLYLWGLVAGSTAQKRNFGFCVDVNQEHLIRTLAKKLGLTVRVEAIRRARRRYAAERTPNYYRKLRITFPSILFKLLECLGGRNPRWLSLEQRGAWLEGYLNSVKLQCQIHHQMRIAPKITICAPKILLQEIQEVFDGLGIIYSIYQDNRRFQLLIQRHASLRTLVQAFAIRRPKVRALVALLQKFDQDAALRLSLHKLNLTEFQLTLYGVALDAITRPGQELEYTVFESVFARSSNEIRQNLYQFDQWGLISYFERENSKEYFALSTRYLANLGEMMRQELEELKTQLKYTDSNALSFHCLQCDKIVGYADAIGDHAFECPDCHSTDLRPIELSRYFFYGHLGNLTQQQKLIAEALA